VVIFFITRKSTIHSHPGSRVKPSISTLDPTVSLPARPEPLAAVVAALPSVRSKKRTPPPVPVRRQLSTTASQSGMPTLSAIGDFAVTRDDGGQYTTIGSVQRETFSRASHRRGENGNTLAVVSSCGSPMSEDDAPFGSEYQSGNMMQMMPTLRKGGSSTISTSLEESREEDGDSPVKLKSSSSSGEKREIA